MYVNIHLSPLFDIAFYILPFPYVSKKVFQSNTNISSRNVIQVCNTITGLQIVLRSSLSDNKKKIVLLLRHVESLLCKHIIHDIDLLC